LNGFAVADHPVNDQMDDLLFLKNADLKRRAAALNIDENDMDRRSNPSIRSAIWSSANPLAREPKELPLDKEDAKKIWEGEGNEKFYSVINPRRMQTILVEGDSHSLARVRNAKVQRRYKNGIGQNVTIIPKGAGVDHDYFPTEPAALEYLKKALELPVAGTGPSAKPAG